MGSRLILEACVGFCCPLQGEERETESKREREDERERVEELRAVNRQL